MSDEWRDESMCLGTPIHMWFAKTISTRKDKAKGDPEAKLLAGAKRMCDICPVFDECLDDALAIQPSPVDRIPGHDAGIRANTTLRMRRMILDGEIPRPRRPFTQIEGAA